jgi:hypothetical protein
MSETPRTDAALAASHGQWSYELVELCRTLERELCVRSNEVAALSSENADLSEQVNADAVHGRPDGFYCFVDDRYDEIEAKLPLGYLFGKCNDWDDFCKDTGLNPWLLNEGIADSRETHPVKIATLRKHGILR